MDLILPFYPPVTMQMTLSVMDALREASLGYIRDPTLWGLWPFLPLIRQATLILSGDDDPLIPLANARLMHSLIPRSQLHVYHGGHLGLATEAAELAPVVGRFLAAGAPGDDGRAAQNGPPG